MCRCSTVLAPAALALVGAMAAELAGGDWPMWRHGPERGGFSSEELPRSLHLRWILELPAPRPAWPSTQKKLQFDRLYEPVLAGKRLVVGSMLSDRLCSYDTDSGRELWRFYADGPIRFAPVLASGRVYAVSDDGFLYCLRASDGTLVWKFRGGPSDRLLLGNDRLISAWPARGAPVLRDGTVYFAAGIWPFMGIFIHALDADTGRVVWTNSGSGAAYLTQQHSSPAFAGVAPQGYMAATEEHLVVAGGRTVPAVYDRANGSFLHFNVSSRSMGSKGGGGYEVVASEEFYINRSQMYRIADGTFVGSVDAAVLADGELIGASGGELVAHAAGWKTEERRDRRGKVTRKIVIPALWKSSLEGEVDEAFIRSGSRVYCRGKARGSLLAVDLPRPGREPRVSWTARIDDQPLNMIAGDGKLLVSTARGNIYCFAGESSVGPVKPAHRLELIGRGATWKYLDGDRAPGPGWTAPDHDDADWKSGPAQLGYGEDDESTTLDFGGDPRRKRVTYYFRHAFEIPHGTYLDRLELGVLVDDGAIVYIDGQEVGRLFMPDGVVAPDTLASRTGEENAYHSLSVPVDLAAGRSHVIAVEVHQVSRTSSDLGFDLELEAITSGRMPDLDFPRDDWTRRAGAMIRASGARAGYALVLGLGSGRLAEELIRQTELHVVVIESEGARVEAFRRRLDTRNAYGTRVAVVRADPLGVELPRYMAELIVSEDPTLVSGTPADPDRLGRVYRSLRPHTGVACLEAPGARFTELSEAVDAAGLDGARLERLGPFALLRRTRAPEGAADWTHQYGDSGNTVVSRDRLVKSPLGLLWFGGPSNEGVLPRHGHGPTPQVVAGRVFIEGRDMLRATDAYTGRLLWQRTLEGVGKYYDYTSHEPGANILGSNYVSQRDGVYVVHRDRCLRLDPATGATISSFRLDGLSGEGDPPAWGYVGIWKKYLVAGARPTDLTSPEFSARELAGIKGEALKEALARIDTLVDFEPESRLTTMTDAAYLEANLNRLLFETRMLSKIPAAARRKAGAKVAPLEKRLASYLSEVPGRSSRDHAALVLKRELLHEIYGLPRYQPAPPGKQGSLLRSGSKRLVVLDRYSGEILWEHEARHEIRHNTIALGGGTVFFIDRLSDSAASYHRRRGATLPDPLLVARDLRNGREIWSTDERVFGTWLGYSSDHDVLLEAGSRARDRAEDEVGRGMTAYRGVDGEVLWRNDDNYSGPCLLLDDTIITQGYNSAGFAFDLLTGKQRTRRHPVSGRKTVWSYIRNYGCNTAIGAPHLLTFRSAAAGYYDLAGDGGTGNWGGFRSGCTSNLIPAGGILNAPDYTRTCTCSYQNQASLALVHLPSTEVWTFSSHRADGAPVRRLGLNFGAPGDRRGPDGTLWLDYPSVGGPSPDVPVETFLTTVRYPRRHSSSVTSHPLDWVGASALAGGGGLAIQLRFPDEVHVQNEVARGSPLRASNATVAASVPLRGADGAVPANLTSLRRSYRGGELSASIAGYEALRSGSVSVELWARIDSDFLLVDARGTGEPARRGFVLGDRTPRVRYFVEVDPPGPAPGAPTVTEVDLESGSRVADNRWTHLAFTYDAPSGTGSLFVDGERVASHDGPDGSPLHWGAGAMPDIRLGRGASGHSYLDELRLFARALEPHEFLTSLPLTGDGASPGGLVGYWRMESGPNSTGRAAVSGGQTYTVRLIFAEIEGCGAGERVFDVALQGRTVLRGFDIARAAGGPGRVVVREFQRVFVRDHLWLTLRPRGGGEPLLSGIELIESERSF